MSDKPMKLTCQGSVKRNAYILPSNHYLELRNTVSSYLFGNVEAINQDFRIYWIDEDNDEIDIVNQSDYNIFLQACKDRLHLHAIAKSENGSDTGREAGSNPNKDGMFPTEAVHTHVECDGCMLKPIVGFRYKCIECHDYDLCQNCEAKHVHPNHMMVRMPSNECPNLIEAWVTGRSKRGHRRSGRGGCPVVPDLTNAAAPGSGDSERHHRRSHRRRDFNNGVFGHLYKMMVDLAEGGVQVTDEAAANAANVAAECATAAANAASTAAACAASQADKVSAQACASVNAKIAHSVQENENLKEQHIPKINNGAVPKTPPSTPRVATSNNNEPNSEQSTPSLEDLSQFIHPQYMRTGIEILNNFSEMFAKMLDPEDGVGMSIPSGNPAKPESRKASTSSTVNTSANVENPNVGIQTSVSCETDSTSPVVPSKASEEQRRSPSVEENDWQVIDSQVTIATEKNLSPKKPLDYAQLSKDLKAHIEDEQKRQIAPQQQQATATAEGSTPTSASIAAANNSESVAATPVAPCPQKTNDDKRGVLFYHPDPRINNAVHAMIAMGFSNEGAWLTQLLESVNGSIPDALDLMNAAQRNNN